MAKKRSDVQQRIDAARPFEEWYSSLQQTFPHAILTPSDEMIPLVSGQKNVDLPIHRWYNLKESFAAELPIWISRWMQERYQHTPCHVFEPFLGSGTTGVSLALEGLVVKGIEYNPFIRFVAEAKAAITQIKSVELEQAIAKLSDEPFDDRTLAIPLLSTLHNRKYSDEQNVRTLLSAYDCVTRLDTSAPIQALLHLGIAAAIEDVFNLRKDGRALRYVQKQGNIPVAEIIRSNWRAMLEDVQQYEKNGHGCVKTGPLFTVYRGSASNLKSLHTPEGSEICLVNDAFDTIMYSPPYLNNFDYSEVYKLELWLLHFLESYEEWKMLRSGTIRSHSSIFFPQTTYLASDSRTQEIAKNIEAMSNSQCLPDEDRHRSKPGILGYFDDMYLALCEQWRVLKPGGILTYVVANSRHYFLPIATDLILAEIAYRIGFEPLDLVVLRKRNGRTRQKLYLRESAVFLRKPNR